jgi:hypothetical protein
MPGIIRRFNAAEDAVGDAGAVGMMTGDGAGIAVGIATIRERCGVAAFVW